MNGSAGIDPDTPIPATQMLSLQEPQRRGGWSGHLVAVGAPIENNDAGWLADLTSAQFDRPDKGLEVGGAVIGNLPAGFQINPYEVASVELAGGGRIVYVLRPELRGFRTTPAWRADIDLPLIDQLCEAVLDRVTRALLEGEEPPCEDTASS